jgi:NAD(P)-dependent dehydrogenase (short-subunit alcohol dehydrogenase family)
VGRGDGGHSTHGAAGGRDPFGGRVSNAGDDGRCILITGAANGIGAETARRLAIRGWSVVLVDVDAPALAATTATLGFATLPIRADVTDEAAMRAAVAAAVDRFGRLDVVVANPGIEILGPVASVASDDVVRLIDVDLVGVWTTIRVALAEIPRARGARRLSARRLPGDSRTPPERPSPPRRQPHTERAEAQAS